MKPTVLALFDVNANLKVSADASCFGLGAVLLQNNNNDWQPVAFASRVMSDTERRYAQVEKEALAITWACDKFSTYILGKKFMIKTDHKPLVPLLGTKHLDDLLPEFLDLDFVYPDLSMTLDMLHCRHIVPCSHIIH